MTEVRTVQVLYGYLEEKISRKQTERFILAHNQTKEHPLPIPTPPIARFWCRRAPDGLLNDEGQPVKWMIGWTSPIVVGIVPAAPNLVSLQ